MRCVTLCYSYRKYSDYHFCYFNAKFHQFSSSVISYEKAIIKAKILNFAWSLIVILIKFSDFATNEDPLYENYITDSFRQLSLEAFNYPSFHSTTKEEAIAIGLNIGSLKH
jgi:hypothetical protein